MNIFPSLITGLICTAGLFLISFIIVVSAKALIDYIKRRLPKKQMEQKPQPSEQKKPQKKKSATVRSIEIDPSQIDRIYVKKIS